MPVADCTHLSEPGSRGVLASITSPQILSNGNSSSQVEIKFVWQIPVRSSLNARRLAIRESPTLSTDPFNDFERLDLHGLGTIFNTNNLLRKQKT